MSLWELSSWNHIVVRRIAQSEIYYVIALFWEFLAHIFYRIFYWRIRTMLFVGNNLKLSWLQYASGLRYQYRVLVVFHDEGTFTRSRVVIRSINFYLLYAWRRSKTCQNINCKINNVNKSCIFTALVTCCLKLRKSPSLYSVGDFTLDKAVGLFNISWRIFTNPCLLSNLSGHSHNSIMHKIGFPQL